MKLRFFLAALLVPFPALAYESNLPKHSLLCGSKSQMEEAVKAIDRSDVPWLESLHSCFVTNQAVKAERIDCGMRTCQIRYWVPNHGSSVGYTMRNYLASN